MGGLTLYGSLMIGLILILGQRLFPDNVVMWLASPEHTILAWRELIVVSLIVLAMVRQYYHNLFLQLVWAIPAVGLWWAGGNYFLNNPSYVFDAMLMVGAGTAFAITALLPNSEPLDIRSAINRLTPKLVAYRRSRPQPADRLANWRYISDAKAVGHRLTVPWQVNHTIHR